MKLIEWFYALPKSPDRDPTWNRKTGVAALLNQWTAQVEFAQAMRDSMAKVSEERESHKPPAAPSNFAELREKLLAHYEEIGMSAGFVKNATDAKCFEDLNYSVRKDLLEMENTTV
jgi:hypothetical protein